jgi:hypothetical protein
MTGNEAKTKLTPEQQSEVLYWTNEADIPIIPCDSKTKSVYYKDWTNTDFSQNEAKTQADYCILETNEFLVFIILE